MPDLRPVVPDLIKILMELHQQHGSAVVRVEQRREKKQFVVRRGRLVFAESNVPGEHLARVLVRMNLLAREALPKIASAMRDGRNSDQAVLETSGLRAEDLERGGREQSVSMLASLFAWERAEIKSYSAAAIPDRLMDLCMGLPELVLQAARTAARARQLPVAFRALSGFVGAAQACASWAPEFPLEKNETRALSLCQSPTRPDDLAALLPEDSSPVEIVQRLLLTGLLRLAVPGRTSAGEPDSAGIIQEMEEMLGRIEVANLYETLSVEPGATDTDVKNAYHLLAKRYHPDRFQSGEHTARQREIAEKLFTYITGAYTTLSNPAARAVYDSERLKKDSQVEAALQARGAADLEREKMAEAIFHAGRVSLAKGDSEKAASQFKECCWLLPKVARYQHYLGVAQSGLPGMQKEAEQHLLKAIELDEAQVESRLALGRLYLKVKLPRRAEAQFCEVLKWDPSNRDAQQLLERIGSGDRST